MHLHKKQERDDRSCERLCEFALPELAPEKVLFHTETYRKLNVQMKLYLPESSVGAWGPYTQDVHRFDSQHREKLMLVLEFTVAHAI